MVDVGRLRILPRHVHNQRHQDTPAQARFDQTLHGKSVARRKRDLPDGPDARLLVAMIMGGLRQAAGQALADPGAWRHERLKRELWAFVANAAGVGFVVG